MRDPGYSIIEGVLSSQECDTLADALAGGDGLKARAGARNLMSDPKIAALAAAPRLVQLASAALGREAVPYRATLFAKGGRVNWLVAWHQDTTLPLTCRTPSDEWGPWSTKAGVFYAHAPAWALERVVALRIHLDASTPENGPLRVLPGSHCAGVLAHEQILAMARRHEAIECIVGRGGVVAMRPLLIHASSKARLGHPRRVIHIEYAECLDVGAGLRLAIA